MTTTKSIPGVSPLPRHAAGLALLCLAIAAALPVTMVSAQEVPTTAAAPVEAPADPAAELQRKSDQTRAELAELQKTISLSSEKTAGLQASIDALEKSTANLRQSLIDSASRRKALEKKVSDSEKRLTGLKTGEERIVKSLHERRGVLAEVLAALQRMGRNPPPALLVTPEDALGSVRSAILLGAVVPGIRTETDKLVGDLKELTSLKTSILAEKTTLTETMTSSLEEERRMDLLLTENDKLSKRNAGELDAERRRSEELAGKTTSLEGLISSLEGEISSVHEAVETAKAEEQRRMVLSDEQRAKAREFAENGVPDKNRIAPAYPFSELKQKLDMPVAGDILREFGVTDDTGHPARGIIIASNPGALITAPADGLVVFAGKFRSYGQMIILNVGDGYHLVFSGMEEVKTRQGKFVFAGEPLAVMGEKRVASATALALETDRPTLYIEFRKDGKPVDSRPWWTAKGTGKAHNDS
jgi:septal ring factor EnvC (AmiA/AmiB activator)